MIELLLEQAGDPSLRTAFPAGTFGPCRGRQSFGGRR